MEMRPKNPTTNRETTTNLVILAGRWFGRGFSSAKKEAIRGAYSWGCS
jgi:hypothetical protein